MRIKLTGPKYAAAVAVLRWGLVGVMWVIAWGLIGWWLLGPLGIWLGAAVSLSLAKLAVDKLVELVGAGSGRE